MTPTTHTIIALHIVHPTSQDAAYVVGYLVSETDERIIIARAIHAATGAAFSELAIEKHHIKQRYSLPVTWW